MSKTRSSAYYRFLILFLVALGGLPIDIYLPSLPDISREFHCSQSAAQLSIPLFLISLGLCQMLFGQLSDRYGRRRFIIGGCFCTALLFFVITLSNNIVTFNLIRLAQGAATSSFIASIRALMKDRFHGTAYKKIVNQFLITWTLGPIIAPTIGGYCQHHFGWTSCFFLLGSYVGIGGLLACAMDKQATVHATKTETLFLLLRQLITSPYVIIPALQCATVYSILTVANIYVPFIIQNQLHMSAVVNGYISSAFGLAWLIGNLINRRLLTTTPTKVLLTCLSYLACVIGISAIFTNNSPPSLWGTIAPIILLLPGLCLFYSTLYSMPMEHHPEASGLAGGILGSSVCLGSGIVGSLASIHLIQQGIQAFLIIAAILFTVLLISTLKLRQLS